MEKEKLHELIDACGPAGPDPDDAQMGPLREALQQDPELARALETVQRWDASIGSTFKEVAVPKGLAERLHRTVALQNPASLQNASTPAPAEPPASAPAEAAGDELLEEGSASEPVASDPAPDDRVQLAADSTSPVSRRWWWIGAATVAASALVIVAVLFRGEPEPIGVGQLAAEVPQWTHDVLEGESSWESIAEAVSLPPEVQRAPQGQKQLKIWNDRQARVYNLATSSRPPALLFVIRCTRPVAVRPVPYTLVPVTSGGMTVVAWQSRGELYVLVVDSDRPLSDFVRTTPLT